MSKQIQIILLALCFSILAAPSTAIAALDIVEEVTEADARSATLPRSEAGQVSVSECSGCPLRIWRVNARTGYFVGRERNAVSLAELRSAADGYREAMVYVFYRPGTNEVTRIVVTPSN